jgi:hypothetical protein
MTWYAATICEPVRPTHQVVLPEGTAVWRTEMAAAFAAWMWWEDLAYRPDAGLPALAVPAVVELPDRVPTRACGRPGTRALIWPACAAGRDVKRLAGIA